MVFEDFASKHFRSRFCGVGAPLARRAVVHGVPVLILGCWDMAAQEQKRPRNFRTLPRACLRGKSNWCSSWKVGNGLRYIYFKFLVGHITNTDVK